MDIILTLKLPGVPHLSQNLLFCNIRQPIGLSTYLLISIGASKKEHEGQPKILPNNSLELNWYY